MDGLGTNIGLKRVCVGDQGEGYRDVLYACHRFLTKEDLRGLTPLIYSSVNPYGLMRLNTAEHYQELTASRCSQEAPRLVERQDKLSSSLTLWDAPMVEVRQLSVYDQVLGEVL